ncbi:7783_t:CDS:1 [Cetraspora pellucida]|uniref:DNA-directed DNA polymerase n=1 Tax=Cetraspora pellucida TaxID=1433469 RepID=A0A9N9NBZ5_9GLOM|nr:7783_t:CDS:1 [Cetraspora pellucida]
MLEKLSDQLSKLINIPFSNCLNAFQVSESMLEDYVIELAYYCSVDTLCLHKLNLKRNIISDYVQRARIAYVTISKCLIRNLLSRYASPKKILVSSRRKRIVEQGMYDGGLVITPIKNIKRPVADVDFTSYYPHAIIQNNISLEKHVSKDSTNPHLNVVIDNDIVYGKFLPHDNDINNIDIMALICKELLEK